MSVVFCKQDIKEQRTDNILHTKFHHQEMLWINGLTNLSVMQLSIYIDLSFSDVAGQVRNRMCNI